MIDVEIIFLSAEQGGRRHPLNLKLGGYRPHLRIHPTQPLLGVEFTTGPEIVEANMRFKASVRLIYDDVDYSSLTEGTQFEIVEGPKVVGSGIIIQRNTQE